MRYSETSKRYKPAFTLAEMMIVMLILSIVTAAFLPIITKRSKTTSQIWQYAANNSDIFAQTGSLQSVIIGGNSLLPTDASTKFLINAPSGTHQISFKQSDVYSGSVDLNPRGVAVGNGATLNGTSTTGEGIAIGKNAQSGSNGVAIGSDTKAPNATTTAIGNYALSSNTGARSTAVGNQALFSNSGGADNVAVGMAALYTNNASWNTGIGTYALYANKGNGNTALGYDAMFKNDDGTYNIGIGFQSMFGNISGGSNVGIGYQAMHKTTTSNNTSVGSKSMYNNTTGVDNTAIGSEAMRANVAGKNNTAVGRYALWADFNDTSDNVGVGFSSLAYGQSVAVGSNAAAQKNSVAIGYCIQNGEYSVAIGSAETTNPSMLEHAAYNKAISIGFASQAYSESTAIGYKSYAASLGQVGAIAIGNESNAKYSSAIGIGATATASNGGAIAIGGEGYVNGASVLSHVVSSGSWSIAMGGASSATGNYSIAIGTPATASAEYGIAIGNGANAQYSKSVAIGTTVSTENASEIRLGNASYTVQIPGSLYVTSTKITSDKRLKNIKGDYKNGIDKIREINPIEFTYKNDNQNIKRVGVIAQDLQKIIPDAVSKDPKGYLAIRTEDMFYAMLNSIKELDVIVQNIVKDLKIVKEKVQTLVVKVQMLDDKVAALFKVNQIESAEIKNLKKQNKELVNKNKSLENQISKINQRLAKLEKTK